MFDVLAQSVNAMDQLPSFGVAGIMGAMWLWERRTSQKREQQIDEAHARIMTDRVQLDQLIAVVRQNSQTMSQLATTQQQLIEDIRRR